MARDISISISAKDNFTDSIKKMKDMQTSFRKDLGQLNTELDKMNNNKINLKVDMAEAKNEVKEAEKAFKKLGDEASRNKLIMAETKYDNIKRNLDLVSQGAKQAEKDIKNLTDVMARSEMNDKNLEIPSTTSSMSSDLGKGIDSKSAITPSTTSSMSSDPSNTVLSQLGKAGLFNTVGQSISDALGTATTSLFGSSEGQTLSSIVGGAITGAAIGSIVPGIGTAIGAAVGTLAGSINAMTQKLSEKDDVFKEVVQSNYELAKSIQSSALTNGSGIAGSREQTRISFSTLLGGEDIADGFLKELTEFAVSTPFGFDELTTMSKTLLAYGYKMEEIIPLLTKVGDGGSALGLGSDDINTIATMLGRMETTGKTTLEYLNPIMERGIPVLDFLSESLGVAKERVLEMVSDGLIPGSQAAQIIADAMGETYAGNMEKQSSTFEGLKSSLEDVQNQIDQAMGEAYNEKRKEGLNAQIDFLSGENGKKMEEAYAMIGEWQAELENGYDKAIRDAMTNMMESEEYINAEAEGDKVKMGQLLAEAQVKGENEYKLTEGYQLQLASDLELIGKIRQDTVLHSEYYDTGYQMGQEYSKGIAAGIRDNYIQETPSAIVPSTISPNSNSTNIHINGNNYGLGYAYGLDYVPYDQYPALLHEGEKILTANEARNYREGGEATSINISGNVFNVKEDADIEKIAAALVQQIQEQKIVYGG